MPKGLIRLMRESNHKHEPRLHAESRQSTKGCIACSHWVTDISPCRTIVSACTRVHQLLFHAMFETETSVHVDKVSFGPLCAGALHAKCGMMLQEFDTGVLVVVATDTIPADRDPRLQSADENPRSSNEGDAWRYSHLLTVCLHAPVHSCRLTRGILQHAQQMQLLCSLLCMQRTRRRAPGSAYAASCAM